ncbi:hypothetical protein T05_13387 [Trichinella murrelli]|uniref:Uncharacterized protein n=1 Tax=Trichinella murrelli TaxID=144512 RepID=A0A0V0T547_9BILA|nr:hypothetical protein T05_13387 [Trichinella murrelli]
MFDGSAEWNSTSLNSCLDPGPNHHASLAPRIQDSTAADTEKMYLQVKLLPDDRDVPFYTEGWVLHSPHEGLPVDAGEVRPYMLPLLAMQLVRHHAQRRLKFPSLWRPSQFLDKSIIEAAEKLSISRKEFVCDLPIEWPKILESCQCFGKLEMSWFSGIVERPSNTLRAYLLFEKEDVKTMLASSRHVGDGYEVKLKDSSGEPRPVVLKPWIMTEGVCLDDHAVEGVTVCAPLKNRFHRLQDVVESHGCSRG